MNLAFSGQLLLQASVISSSPGPHSQPEIRSPVFGFGHQETRVTLIAIIV